MSYAKQIAEMLVEYGRLQFEAGRLSAELEHHYSMAFAIRDQPSIPDEPSPVADHISISARDLSATACFALGQRILHEVMVNVGDEITSPEVRRRLSVAMGSEVNPHDFHNAMRSLQRRGHVAKLGRGVYRRLNGIPVSGAHDAHTGETS